MNRSSPAAVFLISLLLLYYEVYRWIPLGKWNWQFRWPVKNDQFYPDIVIGLLLTFFLAAFLRTWRAGMWVGVALLGLWACVHFFDWWLPYLQSSRRTTPVSAFTHRIRKFSRLSAITTPQMEVMPFWIFFCTPRGLPAY